MDELHSDLGTDYHLALPQVALESNLYQVTYAELSFAGDYIILDNGAAELGNPLPWDKIMEVSSFINPQELVLPDVYKDPEGTKKAVQAWEDYDHRGDIGRLRDYKYMAVVAGATYQNCMKLVSWYANKPYINTLGIPRHFVNTIGMRARIQLAGMIHDLYGDRFELHMLGTNPTWMEELKEFKGMHIVRGVDTSAPFNYAFHGSYVNSGRHFSRPTGYFELPASAFNTDVARTNIAIMKGWLGI
jgi:hypothetical protein